MTQPLTDSLTLLCHPFTPSHLPFPLTHSPFHLFPLPLTSTGIIPLYKHQCSSPHLHSYIPPLLYAIVSHTPFFSIPPVLTLSSPFPSSPSSPSTDTQPLHFSVLLLRITFTPSLFSSRPPLTPPFSPSSTIPLHKHQHFTPPPHIPSLLVHHITLTPLVYIAPLLTFPFLSPPSFHSS